MVFKRKSIKIFTLTIFLACVCCLQLLPYKAKYNTGTAGYSSLLRRAKQARLDFLLARLTPEVISGVESQAKFVVHSGPSGVGQGTTKQEMLKLYPDRFQRFLLYATRSPRGVDFTPADPRYAAVTQYLDMHRQGKAPSSIDELMSLLSVEQRDAILGLEQKKQKELAETLFPEWDKILAGASRQHIPGINERFKISDGRITAYTEFNGVHYWFVSEKELFRLRETEGVIVEPVRDYFQGFDVKRIEEVFRKGDGKIYILEGDRIWLEHVKSRFFDATSIFIAPISDSEFKERMIGHLGEASRGRIMGSDIPDLLKGGIEKYIGQQQPELTDKSLSYYLTPEENKALLNIRNAALAGVGYKILHPEIEIGRWLTDTGLAKKEDLDKINTKFGLTLTFERIVEIANGAYEKISEDELILVAMGVIIGEMVRRIENRFIEQGQNLQDFPQLAETYVRASQSPREYGGSADYDEILVNTWGQLNSSVQGLTITILEKLLQDIIPLDITP